MPVPSPRPLTAGSTVRYAADAPALVDDEGCGLRRGHLYIAAVARAAIVASGSAPLRLLVCGAAYDAGAGRWRFAQAQRITLTAAQIAASLGVAAPRTARLMPGVIDAWIKSGLEKAGKGGLYDPKANYDAKLRGLAGSLARASAVRVDPTLLDDLISDTLEDIMQPANLKGLDPGRNPLPFIVTMFKRRLLNQLRTNGRWKMRNQETNGRPDEEGGEETQDEALDRKNPAKMGPDPLALMEQHELVHGFVQFLMKQPNGQNLAKMVPLLLDKVPSDEIAAKMSRSEAAMSLWYGKLKAIMTEYAWRSGNEELESLMRRVIDQGREKGRRPKKEKMNAAVAAPGGSAPPGDDGQDDYAFLVDLFAQMKQQHLASVRAAAGSGILADALQPDDALLSPAGEVGSSEAADPAMPQAAPRPPAGSVTSISRTVADDKFAPDYLGNLILSSQTTEAMIDKELAEHLAFMVAQDELVADGDRLVGLKLDESDVRQIPAPQ